MSGETPQGSHNHALQFRLVTGSRWMVCHTNTTHPRLVDLLNANPGQTILVQVDSLGSTASEGTPASAPAGYAAGVNIGTVLFGIPIESTGAAPAPRKSAAWVERSLWRARIGLGPYEIVGNVHLPKGALLSQETLTALAGFLVVTEATVTRGDGLYAEERVVAVNQACMEYILPEPAAGEVSASRFDGASLVRF